MIKKTFDYSKILAAYLLFSLGVLGLILPIIPGIVLIIISLKVLASSFIGQDTISKIKKLGRKIIKRYPLTAPVLQKIRIFL